mmetsp:Transcript_2023/g.4171  ORF Transcript_2023/g.4171 Transcript_2023/m.4171 type:complete len:278 (+) Transcript_2023:98-931(+)
MNLVAFGAALTASISKHFFVAAETTTLEVQRRLTIEYTCVDPVEGTLSIACHFHDTEPSRYDDLLPWMAIAYRRQPDCLMVALDRSDQEMVTLTQHNETLAIEAHRTFLPTSAKMYVPSAFDSIYTNMVPLSMAQDYSEVSVTYDPDESDTVSLRFVRRVPKNTTRFSFMYAVGGTSTFDGEGHATRGCFSVPTDVPCAAAVGDDNLTEDADRGAGSEEKGAVGEQKPQEEELDPPMLDDNEGNAFSTATTSSYSLLSTGGFLCAHFFCMSWLSNVV